jgi:hypothetical protein
MVKLVTFACAVAAALSIAGAAAALNPQPLPPRCLAGVHCGGPTGSHPHQMAMSHARSYCKIVHHHRICRR